MSLHIPLDRNMKFQLRMRADRSPIVLYSKCIFTIIQLIKINLKTYLMIIRLKSLRSSKTQNSMNLPHLKQVLIVIYLIIEGFNFSLQRILILKIHVTDLPRPKYSWPKDGQNVNRDVESTDCYFTLTKAGQIVHTLACTR